MEIQEIDPTELYLDVRNPRFGLSEATSEEDALNILIETADLKELWSSISERGFEKYEPLVATRENGKLIVLEGNRRLAAVKLLLDPDLIASSSPRKRIPDIPQDKLETCKKIPVAIVDNRESAAGYIGFKHVNGPARWSSIAKARFGVRFFESLDGKESPQERMQSLTKQLGDSRGVIIRLLVAYKIVRQAIKLGILDELGIDDKRIEFSHLYTLINNPDSREFMGLPRAPLSESLVKDNPVPETHAKELKEIFNWLYGSKSVIKSQGTDRPRLQRVLASEEGLKELRLSGDLNTAETVAGLRNEDWLNSLAKVSRQMNEVTSKASIVFDGLNEDDTKQARSFLKRLKRMISQLEAVFPESEKE